MHIRNFVLGATIVSARFLEDQSTGRPLRSVEHDFTEVGTIGFDGDNLAMSVYIGATDFFFTESEVDDVVVRLEFYDVLLG